MQLDFSGLILALLGVHLLFVAPVALVCSYADRKIGADLQARVGPNRIGPAGFFQAIADQIKLLQKKPGELKGGPERYWTYFQIAALNSALVSVPIVSGFLMTENELSVFLPFIAIVSVVFSDFFVSLVKPDLSRWMSGLRFASQAGAGLLPALVSVVTVGMVAGSFDWLRLIELQSGSILNWMIFRDPFVFLSFFIFMTSGMMLLSVSPFDSAFAAPDVQAGLMKNAASQRALLKAFVRFYSLLVWALLASGLFLGGWSIPFDAGNWVIGLIFGNDAPVWISWVLGMLWVFMKTAVILVCISVVGRVMPRVRFDQVMQLGWRVMGPTSLVCLVLAAVLRASGGTL